MLLPCNVIAMWWYFFLIFSPFFFMILWQNFQLEKLFIHHTCFVLKNLFDGCVHIIQLAITATGFKHNVYFVTWQKQSWLVHQCLVCTVQYDTDCVPLGAKFWRESVIPTSIPCSPACNYRQQLAMLSHTFQYAATEREEKKPTQFHHVHTWT